MSVGRWCAVLACLFLISPAAARRPSGHSVSSRSSGNGEVVVHGAFERRQSDWRRAESAHVILIGQDSAAELARVSRNLERLYQLMSRLYRRGETADDTVKLQVVLFAWPADFGALGLRNLRVTEGPYLPAFSDPTYYDPREDGEVLAVSRSDQIVNLNTARAYNEDCDAFHAGEAAGDGGSDLCGIATIRRHNIPFHDPAIRTWEQLLYARFAEHFLLTYDPAAYPRWYLDGIGALFSTVLIGRDGSINYGEPPQQFRQVFHSFGDLKVAEILTGRYLDATPGKAMWSPYHAWLLTHYFLFSELKPERAAQFRHYMTAVREGVPMAEAAKVFGDMGALQRDVARTVDADVEYSHAEPPQRPIQEPTITTLPAGSTALIAAKVELGAYLATAPTAAGTGAADAWLAQVRAATERRHDREAILFAAEAECRTGRPDECLADAQRMLARKPDDAAALGWKGMALTDQAIAGPVANRAETLALARKTLERAIALDGAAPLPRIAYFQSFTKAGERVPDQALLGMAQVIREIPAAPDPRLYLGEELVRQGKADLARQVLHVVLYSPYDMPEKKAAELLFASGGKPTAAAP